MTKKYSARSLSVSFFAFLRRLSYVSTVDVHLLARLGERVVGRGRAVGEAVLVGGEVARPLDEPLAQAARLEPRLVGLRVVARLLDELLDGADRVRHLRDQVLERGLRVPRGGDDLGLAEQRHAVQRAVLVLLAPLVVVEDGLEDLPRVLDVALVDQLLPELEVVPAGARRRGHAEGGAEQDEAESDTAEEAARGGGRVHREDSQVGRAMAMACRPPSCAGACGRRARRVAGRQGVDRAPGLVRDASIGTGRGGILGMDPPGVNEARPSRPARGPSIGSSAARGTARGRPARRAEGVSFTGDASQAPFGAPHPPLGERCTADAGRERGHSESYAFPHPRASPILERRDARRSMVPDRKRSAGRSLSLRSGLAGAGRLPLRSPAQRVRGSQDPVSSHTFGFGIEDPRKRERGERGAEATPTSSFSGGLSARKVGAAALRGTPDRAARGPDCEADNSPPDHGSGATTCPYNETRVVAWPRPASQSSEPR